MKLDLSCPIELRGYTLTAADDAVEASVRLYNLTNRRIASFEAIAKWKSRTSGRSTAMPFCAERLRAGGENGFRITLTCDRIPDADQLEVVFTAVSFEDGADGWRAGEGMIVEIEPLEPISAPDLAHLRAVAGEDAVCFPLEGPETWRCVCGRVNPHASESCVRCHRDRRSALALNRDSVHSLARILHPSMPKTEEAAIAGIQAGYFRQRAKLYRHTLFTAIAILVLTALLILSRQPAEAVHTNAEVVGIYSACTAQQEE